jgi:hypothetical protein
MAAKKVHYITPIGTFNYPWLDTPSKWNPSANDGRGGSKPADPLDLQASYSVKLTVDKDVFNESEFKKQIDEVWDLAKQDNKDKFDGVKDPYWCDEDGNCVITARRNAAFQKGGKIQGMRPKLEDCTGRDITKWIQEEGISVASESIGRLDVTTYIPTPKKNDDGVATLRMNFDLVKAQFKELKRYEGNAPMEAIDGGVPVSDGMEDIPF